MPALARPILVTMVALSGLLVACSPSSAACDGASVELQATIANRTMDPSTLTVCRDQNVTLVVTSDENGVVHVHGYDDLVPPADITAGDPLTLTFSATHVGQFIIAFHAGDGTEVDVGVLTVNVP